MAGTQHSRPNKMESLRISHSKPKILGPAAVTNVYHALIPPCLTPGVAILSTPTNEAIGVQIFELSAGQGRRRWYKLANERGVIRGWEKNMCIYCIYIKYRCVGCICVCVYIYIGFKPSVSRGKLAQRSLWNRQRKLTCFKPFLTWIPRKGSGTYY